MNNIYNKFYIKKIIIFVILNLFYSNLFAKDFSKAYFAGGCFWCMEEAFDKVDGVISTISGFAGGNKANPTYKEVVSGKTGHFETIEITFDQKKISYEQLLKSYWKNIDPFDAEGQFCDKGPMYRSVVFYKTESQKRKINNSVKLIENKFKREVVTFVKKLGTFYRAESYHQDFYEKNFIRYLIYKKNCQREQILDKIWQ